MHTALYRHAVIFVYIVRDKSNDTRVSVSRWPQEDDFSVNLWSWLLILNYDRVKTQSDCCLYTITSYPFRHSSILTLINIYFSIENCCIRHIQSENVVNLKIEIFFYSFYQNLQALCFVFKISGLNWQLRSKR